MKHKKAFIFLMILIMVLAGWILYPKNKQKKATILNTKDQQEAIQIPTQMSLLEDGLSIIRYDEDYGFQDFLDNGGATSDGEVLNYLIEDVLTDVSGLKFLNDLFGCSTIQTQNNQGEILFGRNFDWVNAQALILQSKPKDAYASISTVNLDFISSTTSIPFSQLPDDVIARAALYAPLDGMNEKGLAVSVNMIQDSEVISQSGQSKNLTTTTAIRMLLNKAANVDEAIELLQEYNMHSSMNMMIHFAIVDASGKSVVVEYVNNEMNVIDTPVVTNFYFSEGEKQNIGTAQSHERYERLMKQLSENETMDMQQVRDALDSVSKDNYGEFESTEWSVVYNLNTLEIHYYHRENYEKRYGFNLNE